MTGSRHFKVISPKKIWAVDRVDFSHFDDSIRVQYLLEDIDFTDLCHHQKRNHYEKTFFPVQFLYIEEINPFFKGVGKGVEQHVKHQYSAQMARKSKIVSSMYVGFYMYYSGVSE